MIQALVDYYEQTNANIHRGLHTLAEEATEAYERARGKVARFIGASGPDEILFTRNTTEALNLVAYTWAADNIRAGDEIVISTMEHHSNIVPWQWAVERQGAVLKYVEFSEDGTIDLADVERAARCLAGRRAVGAWVRCVVLSHGDALTTPCEG